MRDIALFIILFCLLPFVLSRPPQWGVYVSAWFGYMNPHRLCYTFMFSFPVVMITAIATLIAMWRSKEKTRMVWSREIILLLIFLLWMGVTTTQAFYFDLAWEQYVKVLKIQILTIMTLVVLNTREKVHIFVWVIVLSLGFYGVKGGIFTILHGGIHRVQGPPGTFIGGNNELALALVMTIPLMRYLHLQEKHFLLKLGLGAAMLLTAIATIGSQSRGALVGIVVMGTLFWIKSRKKVMTALLMVVAMTAIANIMPQEWYDRMNTIKTYEEDASALGRISAWWTAYNVAKDRITGGGFEMFRWQVFQNYSPTPERVHDVHSIYFEILGEHGFIGLGIFLSLLALTWLKCGSVMRSAKKHPEKIWARDLAAMIQVSLVGYMAAGAFLGLAYFDYIYHLVAIIVITSHLISESSKGSRAAEYSRNHSPRARAYDRQGGEAIKGRIANLIPVMPQRRYRHKEQPF